jgi:glycosyltransferase involved in cell wall biosynthesis
LLLIGLLPETGFKKTLKMKILIPVLCFGRSGGYRVLSKIADELIYIGHDVEFLSPDGSEKPYFPTLAKVNWADSKGNIHQNENNNTHTTESFFSIQQKLTRGLRSIPKDAFDIIFANHSLTIFPILRNGLLYKTLYYIQAYEPEYYSIAGGFKHRLLAFLSELTYRKQVYKVVNADVYRVYKKLRASKVLYPGIDFSLFYSRPTKVVQGEADNKIIIGTVGRLEKYKGTTYVLDAFLLIKQQYPDAELHVAFGNPEDFKNHPGVFCFQPDGDVALSNYYRSLNYYFCAGYVQLGAFHYPLAEAMSCGVPVITTAYYPATENNAWVIVPCNAASIVQRFEEAHANPVKTKEKVEQAILDTKQFDWKKVAQRLDGFLNELKLSSKSK